MTKQERNSVYKKALENFISFEKSEKNHAEVPATYGVPYAAFQLGLVTKSEIAYIDYGRRYQPHTEMIEMFPELAEERSNVMYDPKDWDIPKTIIQNCINKTE